MTCSLCGKPAHARGLCGKHYSRWLRHGDQELRYPRTATPTYSAVHKRLVRTRGKATDYLCVDCGQPARDWTYKYGGGGLPYSMNPDDYEPRCVSCHWKLDKPRPLCSVADCEKPHHAKGMCHRHYDALRSATPPPRKETSSE